MGSAVFMDGRVVPPEEALVSVFDRGFLYGDSVYEVLRTFGGRPFALGEHLDRLARSASRLVLGLPLREEIIGAVEQTLEAVGEQESYTRLMVTRGVGRIGLDPALGGASRLLVIVRELELPHEEAYRLGIEAAVVGIRRNDPRALDPAIKSGNYLNNILALAEARRRGAQEALLCNREGQIAEGASCNVFVVEQGGLVTPPLAAGILDGITRRHVMAVAREAGLAVTEAPLPPERLAEAAEAFVTSSIRGVLPVARVNGAPVGTGHPGPISRRVARLYLEHARRLAR